MSSAVTGEEGPLFVSMAHCCTAALTCRRLLMQTFFCEVPRAFKKFGMAIAANNPMVISELLNTGQKAQRINQDARRYGTFAEIGAGQEVARWFFRAGGAAGTVAKTISAYDMAVSDAIYGPTDRYVSRQRLHAMLDYEYELLRTRLAEKRGARTAFFVYANTV